MLLFFWSTYRRFRHIKTGFNTSHVVVFRWKYNKRFCVRSKFQYISCCCFSYLVKTIFSICSRFQYISCCCFSHNVGHCSGGFTMFQYISCCCFSVSGVGSGLNWRSFNTSHVVVFQRFLVSLSYVKRVSIHLMLLFFGCSGMA